MQVQNKTSKLKVQKQTIAFITAKKNNNNPNIQPYAPTLGLLDNAPSLVEICSTTVSYIG